ncbi:condensation domain-containing protein [Sphingomonas sp. 28-63-12]|uniref:condensation domain-containing protein n=1 Tax=Sphingomonas sp. 28-63-12 TaxID=1970434 RepID=UPI0035A92E39
MKALPPIQAATPAERGAVSPAETRLLLAQLGGGHHLNPIHMCVRYEGRIEAWQLYLAVRAVASRHEALRTTFDVTPGGVTRDIRPQLNFHFSVKLQEDPRPGMLEAMLREIGRIMVATPYDDTTGPIFRVILVQSIDACDYVVINVSHLACDAASLSLLLKSIFQAYDDPYGFAAMERGLQAIDFVASQARFLRSADLAESRAAMSLLASARMTVKPFGRSRNGQRPPDRLAVSVHKLPDSYAKGNQRQAKAITAAALVIAAIDPDAAPALLVPRMNRSACGAREIVGYLSNTIVVPLEIDRDQRLSGLLAGAARSLREAAALESVPYALLVGQLDYPPNISVNFFPAAFARDWPRAWSVHPTALVPSMTTAFEIGFYIADSLGELHLQYFDDLVNASEAARCGAMFVTAAAALDGVERPVHDLLAALCID